MAFIYRTENGGALTPSQEKLLENIETLPSPYDGISMLADLRRRTGLSVVVSDRGSLIKRLKEDIDTISKQIDAYQKDANRQKIMNQIERDIYDRRRWAQSKLQEVGNPDVTPLLGLYSRKLLWFERLAPTVYLYADNINDYASRIGKNPDHVFGYVFVHEMMHAYYDAFNNAGYPSWNDLEEAFAEFGMLTFLNSKNDKLPTDLLDDAIEHVQSKIKNPSGPREYGFGFELFDRTGGVETWMINRYREISNWIDTETAGKLDPNYFRAIWRYKRVPDDENATECFKGVEEILKYDWQRPDFIIQPGVRGRRASSGPGFSGPSIGRLRATSEWAITSSMEGWCDQYPFIRRNDLMQLLAEVLKIMKSDGFENYLSINGDCIEFMRRPFFRYETTCPARAKVIPESLCVKGTTVYPAFPSVPLGHSRKLGDFLSVMSIMYTGLFTVVYDTSTFTLYVPRSFAEDHLSEIELEIDSSSKGTSSASTAAAFEAWLLAGGISDQSAKKYVAVISSLYMGEAIKRMIRWRYNTISECTSIAKLDRLIHKLEVPNSEEALFKIATYGVLLTAVKKYREYLTIVTV